MWKAFGPLYRKGWLFQKQNWNPTLCIQNWGHTQSGAAISKLPWKRVYRDVAFSYIYKRWFDSYAQSCSYLPVLSTCRMQRQKGKWWWGVSKSKWCPSWAVLCLHSWARADQHGWVGWLCRSLSAGPLLRRRVGGTRALAHSLYIYIYIYIYILNFTSSWDFVIFREYWISRSRCNIWCSVRAQGWHQKT